MLHSLAWAVLAYAASVAAHGVVIAVDADGKHYEGYNANVWEDELKNPVGWKIPEDHDTGPIYSSAYQDPDIICHVHATNANHSVTVEAGHTISLTWTPYSPQHYGPVMSYLARCNGPCEKVDKTKLQFNKIAEKGYISNNPKPYTVGRWASNELSDAGSKWDVAIPSYVAPGEYVLRHEIISLHQAQDPGGAQNYPQCINLVVTGAGTDPLASGTLGTSLYKEDDPGVLIQIWAHIDNYVIPGPPVYKSGSVPQGAGGPPRPSPVTTYTASPSASSASEAAETKLSSTALSPSATPSASATRAAPYVRVFASPLPTSYQTPNYQAPQSSVPQSTASEEEASRSSTTPPSITSSGLTKVCKPSLPPQPTASRAGYSSAAVPSSSTSLNAITQPTTPPSVSSTFYPSTPTSTTASPASPTEGYSNSKVYDLIDQILSEIEAVKQQVGYHRKHSRDLAPGV